MPVDDLTYVTATIASMYGAIRSAWRTAADGNLTLEVTVPVNASGAVFVLAKANTKVRADGESPGARFVSLPDLRSACGSGGWNVIMAV